jgi:hypothetical protein
MDGRALVPGQILSRSPVTALLHSNHFSPDQYYCLAVVVSRHVAHASGFATALAAAAARDKKVQQGLSTRWEERE